MTALFCFIDNYRNVPALFLLGFMALAIVFITLFPFMSKTILMITMCCSVLCVLLEQYVGRIWSPKYGLDAN